MVASDPDNHDGVITHLGPDILEYEVKWALGFFCPFSYSLGFPGRHFASFPHGDVKYLGFLISVNCCYLESAKFSDTEVD